MMTRGRKPLGELKKCERIHALFTNDEKQRVVAAAMAQNTTVSMFVHQIVMNAVSVS